jgi:hypothetical protein
MNFFSYVQKHFLQPIQLEIKILSYLKKCPKDLTNLLKMLDGNFIYKKEKDGNHKYWL